MSQILSWLSIIGGAVLLVWLWIKSKVMRLGHVIMINGAVKTGKTTLAVRVATYYYNVRLFGWRLHTYVLRFLFYPIYMWATRFRLARRRERPLLYSNIPLRVPYVPVTTALLRREVRPAFGSVVLISESSLVADSMLYHDKVLNEELMLFNKLFAHETHGGYLVYDTQSISDNHYAVKRCLNSYLYIHHTIKVPFFLVMFVREERYSECADNVYTDDVDTGLKWMLVPKKVWKLFDCYTYSALTDGLDVSDAVRKIGKKDRAALKTTHIPSFRHWHDDRMNY